VHTRGVRENNPKVNIDYPFGIPNSRAVAFYARVMLTDGAHGSRIVSLTSFWGKISWPVSGLGSSELMEAILLTEILPVPLQKNSQP
jgi:hypothetical protein